MKRLTLITFAVLALGLVAGCTVDFDKVRPYEKNLYTLEIGVTFQEGFSNTTSEGIEIKVENVDNGASYSAVTDDSGTARLNVVNGLYRVSTTAEISNEFFNGSADGIKVAGKNLSILLNLIHIRKGNIVIKEIYCGGCKKLPYEGDYQSDKYIILHNNSGSVKYLDSLCIGSLSPYNSNSTNPWITKDPETGASVYRDFVPVIQAVLQIGGDGTTFPLGPGEDAVIALCGAIDHTAKYPLSVNLNNEDYFVCYNPLYFPNTSYHPTPGDKIREDHILKIVIKTGQANAYTLSMSSPAVVIFRAKGMSVEDFLLTDNAVIQVPGSSLDQVVCVPLDWVEDAVEVFDKRQSTNKKRIPPVLDAGFVEQSNVYLGHTLRRKVDQEESAKDGFEILVDTNNSSEDMYESEIQSLKEKEQDE